MAGAALSDRVHDLMDLKSEVILDTLAWHPYVALAHKAALRLADDIALHHGKRLRTPYRLMDANDTAATFLGNVVVHGPERAGKDDLQATGSRAVA